MKSLCPILAFLLVIAHNVPVNILAQEAGTDAQDKIRELEAQLAALKGTEASAQAAASPQPDDSTSPQLVKVVGNAPSEPAAKMEPGWIVRIFAVPSDLRTIPLDSVGTFVLPRSSSITSVLHHTNKTVSFYKDQAAYLFEGWLKATQSGRYTFMADIETPPVLADIYRAGDEDLKCMYWFELEGTQILKSGDLVEHEGHQLFEVRTLMGGVDLEPGLYKARQWLACSSPSIAPQNWCDKLRDYTTPEARSRISIPCKSASFRASDFVRLDLHIKEPGALNPRELPPEAILHEVG